MNEPKSEPEPVLPVVDFRAPPYAKWVGVLMGLLLPGSAHFFCGNRQIGIRWLAGCFGCPVAGFMVMALPGGFAYTVGCLLILIGAVMNITVLVSSYRPVPRIGWRRWLALIGVLALLKFSISGASQLVVRPFKLPTGSMEPTLLGIKAVSISPDVKPGVIERWYHGASWKEVRATAPGTMENSGPGAENPLEGVWRIGSEYYSVPSWKIEPPIAGTRFSKDDLIWSGTVTRGDHVICDKLTYLVREPARGEIIVFRTDGMPGLPTGQVYVMRLAGLPGERIRIQPPHLLINGERVQSPEFFAAMGQKRNGLPGYQNTPHADQSEEVDVAPGRYYVLGDNSPNSLDSRVCGTVPRENIVGRVTRIYWPLARANSL